MCFDVAVLKGEDLIHIGVGASATYLAGSLIFSVCLLKCTFGPGAYEYTVARLCLY